MKLLYVFGFLLLMTPVSAQTTRTGLDHDPVFTTVLSKHIVYPVDAERSGVYAKIYAGFRIDQKGHVQQVSVLNPVRVGHGLEEEVLKKLKRLPPLNPRYEGTYAVPIVFQYNRHSTNDDESKPIGSLPSWYYTNRILLNEIVITGINRTSTNGVITPFSQGQVYVTDH